MPVNMTMMLIATMSGLIVASGIGIPSALAVEVRTRNIDWVEAQTCRRPSGSIETTALCGSR